MLVHAIYQHSKEMLPEAVRNAVANLWTEIRIARTARHATKSFQELKGKQALKVHLGCGPDIRTGWVNIDLNRGPLVIDPANQPDTIFINHDLRKGLPLEPLSCDIIYSSHFFEHLEYRQGLQLMRDCHRSLCSGGIFRISLPSLKDFFAAYLAREDSYFDLIKLSEVLPQSRKWHGNAG
ncbi:MAG: class I SAM-dependent methyltransferase [Pyrinomonadaceae bacterium]